MTASVRTTMNATLRPTYGTADVLRLADIDKPVPADDEILVKVRAASVNPYDWHLMRGTPYLIRLGLGLPKPKSPRLGADFSGTVESAGSRVTRFQPGDDVFGVSRGSFAEYVTVSETRVAAKPPGVTFEQAAALPIAGVTALQALRDKGQVQRGQQVLINGAAGGVGTFAVQIAKSLGAEVAAVCSTANVELVRSLGATRVFDYTAEDFAAAGRQFNVLLDNVGNRSLADCRRVLKPRGVYIGNGGGTPDDDRWGFGMLGSIIGSVVVFCFVSQKLRGILANVNARDLAALANLVEAGQLTPVISRRYELRQVPEAIRHLETGHARGKVIIDLRNLESLTRKLRASTPPPRNGFVEGRELICPAKDGRLRSCSTSYATRPRCSAGAGVSATTGYGFRWTEADPPLLLNNIAREIVTPGKVTAQKDASHISG